MTNGLKWIKTLPFRIKPRNHMHCEWWNGRLYTFSGGVNHIPKGRVRSNKINRFGHVDCKIGMSRGCPKGIRLKFPRMGCQPKFPRMKTRYTTILSDGTRIVYYSGKGQIPKPNCK